MQDPEKMLPWLLGAAVLAWWLLSQKSDAGGAGSSEPSAGAGGDSPMGTKQAFVAQLQPIADQVEKETGIRAALGITQAAHESAWGQSQLATQGNNLFGFIAENTYWVKQNLPTIGMPTHEWVSQPLASDVVVSQQKNTDGSVTYYVKRTRLFRRYSDWEGSYRDWARLMQTPHYAAALPFAKAGDLKGFAVALQAAGYATDPTYASKLEGVGAEVADLV